MIKLTRQTFHSEQRIESDHSPPNNDKYRFTKAHVRSQVFSGTERVTLASLTTVTVATDYTCLESYPGSQHNCKPANNFFLKASHTSAQGQGLT